MDQKFTVRHHAVFKAWYLKLKMSRNSALYDVVFMRLERVRMGNLGDHKSVGDGVSELRFNVGAGLRIYYTRRGNDVIFLLCAGDKSSQQADIMLAKQLSGEV